MFKKTGVFIVLAAFLALASGCGGPSIDSDLVGAWEEVDSGDVLAFTEDGKMGRAGSLEEVVYGFDYTASRGEGKYWFPEHPDITSSFEYSISGDNLDFKVSGTMGYSGAFTRLD